MRKNKQNYIEDYSERIKGYVRKNYTPFIYGHEVFKLMHTERKCYSSDKDIGEYWGKIMEPKIIEALSKTFKLVVVKCCTLNKGTQID